MRIARLVSFLCLPVAFGMVDGQEPVVRGPVVELSCDGPAAVVEAFLPTNVGGLLAAKDAESLLEPWRAAFFAGLGAQRDVLWPLLRDYRGRVEFQVFAEPVADRRSHACAVLRLRGDGDTDLDALGEQLGILLRSLGGEDAELTVLGSKLPARKNGGELLVLPHRRGDDLVTAWLDAGAQLLPTALAHGKRGGSKVAAPLQVHLDLEQVVELALLTEGDESRKIAELLLGLSTLDELHVRLKPAGPQVMLEVQCRFAPAPKGLLRGLFPDVQGAPTMTRLVPSDCAGWDNARVRLDLAVDSALDALAQVFQSGDRARLDAELKKEFGFHLIEDLLVHLGDEVLVVGGRWGEEAAREAMPLRGMCFVFPVRDAKAFAEHWPAAQPMLFEGFGADATTAEEHAGVTIHSGGSSWFDEAMHVALAGDLGLVAFGEEGRSLLEGVLDRRRTEPGELPPAVRRVRGQAPPGFHGAARLNMESFLSGSLVRLGQAMRLFRLPAEIEQLAAVLAPFEPLLVQHQLDEVVALSGYDEGTWTLRMLW